MPIRKSNENKIEHLLSVLFSVIPVNIQIRVLQCMQCFLQSCFLAAIIKCKKWAEVSKKANIHLNQSKVDNQL